MIYCFVYNPELPYTHNNARTQTCTLSARASSTQCLTRPTNRTRSQTRAQHTYTCSRFRHVTVVRTQARALGEHTTHVMARAHVFDTCPTHRNVLRERINPALERARARIRHAHTNLYSQRVYNMQNGAQTCNRVHRYAHLRSAERTQWFTLTRHNELN